jgi:hypothetical protein
VWPPAPNPLEVCGPPPSIDGGRGPRAYHLAAADQDRTTERHDRLAAHGILTLHFPPKRVKTDAPGIISELQSAIDKGTARPRLPITAVPQAA